VVVVSFREQSVAVTDTKRLSTKVCLPVLQLNAVKKQFVATRKVPKADSHDLRDRTLVVLVRGAKAAFHVAGSSSLT
jgi:hypothetical protein